MGDWIAWARVARDLIDWLVAVRDWSSAIRDWVDPTAWLRAINAWLIVHVEPIELITVWVLFGRELVLALGKLVSWGTVRQTRDRTPLGQAIKREKLAEAAGRISLGTYWAMVLIGYYTGHQWGLWSNYGIVVVLIIGAMLEAVYMTRFVVTLWCELRQRRHPDHPP